MFIYLTVLFLSALVYSCSPSSPRSTPPAAVEKITVSKKDSSLPLQPLPLFQEPAGSFKIYFPTPPDRTIQKSEIDIGTLEMVQWVSKDASGQFYVLSYADYPKSLLQLGSSKQLLNAIKDRLLSTLHAQEQSNQMLLMDSLHTGIAFKAQAKQQHWHLCYQLYLVQNRLYQLGIHSNIGAIQLQDSLDFFGSFKVFPNKD